MGTTKVRVLQKFPIWRKKEPPSANRFNGWDGMAQPGEVFELRREDCRWHEVGGAYCRIDLPESDMPDFSGARLKYLLKHHYIETG